MPTRPLVGIVLLALLPAVCFGQPDGKKVIPTSRTVELSQEIPGYAFFTVREEKARPAPEPDQPPPLPVYRATRIIFVPKMPQAVPTNLDLQIVPESALKDYPDPEKLGAALSGAIIPGAQSVAMVGTGEEADVSDPRTKAEYRFIIHRVEPNAGVIYDRFSNDPTDPRHFTDGAGNPLPGKPGDEEQPKKSSSGAIVVVVMCMVIVAVATAQRNRRKRLERGE